jgi:membrane-associated phospholipid phosphatase
LRYLVALIWPAGIALIALVTYLLARRSPQAQSAGAAGGVAGTGAAHSGRSHHKAAGSGPGLADATWESIRLIAIAVAGVFVTFGIMCALGLLVVHHGLVIDRPIFNWMHKHEVHVLAALMKRLTKLGDTWTTWGASLAAAACLAMTWRTKRWLPPVALATAIIGDHFTTLALRHVFHRLGPPTSPLGTYPSGGCDRVILFYGLIAYLLWREFSGQRRTAIAFGGVVAALGFNEAFSRVYLSLHWFTDSLSGLFYGCLLLTVFIFAVHAIAGRPNRAIVGDAGQSGQPERPGGHSERSSSQPERPDLAGGGVPLTARPPR